MWQCDSPYLYFLALSLDMVSLKKKKKSTILVTWNYLCCHLSLFRTGTTLIKIVGFVLTCEGSIMYSS